MRVLMKTALGSGLLPLAIALASATGASAPAVAQGASAPLVQLNTNRGRLVQMSAPISDVFVANPAIADVQVRSPTQIYIFGKGQGEGLTQTRRPACDHRCPAVQLESIEYHLQLLPHLGGVGKALAPTPLFHARNISSSTSLD